jgi:hypothetical protein
MKKFNVLLVYAAVITVAFAAVLGTIHPYSPSAPTIQTVTQAVTVTQQETVTQNMGLIYVGSVSNFSQPKNLTYGMIQIQYYPNTGVDVHGPSSARVLMVIRYRGFYNTIILTPVQNNTPYGYLWWGSVPQGTTELDFYILN